MTFLTNSSSLSAAPVDLPSAEARGYSQEVAVSPTDEKWPLWWTVVGVVTFCSTVWATLFSLIF